MSGTVERERTRSGRRGWRVIGGLVAGLALGGLAATPAAAQGVTPPWEVELTAYFWAAALSGDVAVGGSPTVSIDASFKDLLENLDFGAMGAIEVRRGAFGLIVDGMYTKLSKGGEPPGPLFSRADVELKTGILEAALAYRVLERDRVTLDILGGARVWFSETDVRFTQGPVPKLRFNETETWADPIVGARLRWNMSERWVLTLLGDIGGFGVSSDLTWQALGTIGFRITESVTIAAGYRAVAVDYENDGFLLDIVEQGPVVGVAIKF